MLRLVLPIALFAPSALLAHEAGHIPHMHPHGGEAALVALGLVALAVSLVWWWRRS